jgi:hypothetical protein
VDEIAGEALPELKELDTQYQTLIEDTRTLKNDRFNEDGTFKDTAVSRIRNLLSPANTNRLARLEEFLP